MGIKKKYIQKVKDLVKPKPKTKKFKPVPQDLLLRSINPFSKKISLTNTEAYDLLTKGEKVMSLKNKMKIQVRVNKNTTTDGSYPYLLMKDGEKILLIDSAIFHSPCMTSEEQIDESGIKLTKCFITCYANELKIYIEPTTQKVIAEIK